MSRFVHGEGLRERQNMRQARRASEFVHVCRSCRVRFDEKLAECPECGYSDQNSCHGATQVMVR